MGQIYSTRQTDSLQNHNSSKKKVFFNRSSDESFYVIEPNLVLLFLPKTEFFPRTMQIIQKVSKMEDIVRNVQRKTENVIRLLIILVTAKKPLEVGS